MAYTYTLQYPIEADGGGYITEIDIERPNIGNYDAVKQYHADGEEIWMGRLLCELTTLSLAETSQIDINDIKILLNTLSKL